MKLKFQIAKERASGPIVMVDDEELDIEAAQRGLQKSELENEFLSFNDGQPFLDYLEEVKAGKSGYPALVLLDINMPLMSGFEVLTIVRSEAEFAEIPIVSMLTSSTHDADQERALEVGANDYLIKPSNYNDYTEFFNALFE